MMEMIQSKVCELSVIKNSTLFEFPYLFSFEYVPIGHNHNLFLFFKIDNFSNAVGIAGMINVSVCRI